VLPDTSWPDRQATIDALTEHGLTVLDVDATVESKAICAQILDATLLPPIVVIARGDACLTLPAVALSLRTQHRNTCGYVLIDPDAPPATDTWPESPVSVVSSTEATGTSLRGWPVVRSEGNVPELVTRMVDEFLQPRGS